MQLELRLFWVLIGGQEHGMSTAVLGRAEEEDVFRAWAGLGWVARCCIYTLGAWEAVITSVMSFM